MHARWLAADMRDPAVRLHDTWKAMSLRASMSHDIAVDGYFVPEDASAHFPAVVPQPTESVGLPTDPPVLRTPRAAVGIFPAGLALGVAQAALDDTIAYATEAPMAMGGMRKASMPGNQFAVADAAMLIESGRAFLYQEIGRIGAMAAAEETIDLDDANRVTMALLNVRLKAQRAVDRLFEVRGAHGLYEGNSFERYYRDVRVSTLHALMTPDLAREQIGKHLLGIPANVQPRWG